MEKHMSEDDIMFTKVLAQLGLNRWTNETNISDNQQMVTETPYKPEPIIPKKKYCNWNASGSHIKALL